MRSQRQAQKQAIQWALDTLRQDTGSSQAQAQGQGQDQGRHTVTAALLRDGLCLLAGPQAGGLLRNKHSTIVESTNRR